MWGVINHLLCDLDAVLCYMIGLSFVFNWIKIVTSVLKCCKIVL